MNHPVVLDGGDRRCVQLLLALRRLSLAVPAGTWLDTQESFTGFVTGAVIEVIPAPPLQVTLHVATNAILSWNATSNAQYRVEYSTLLTTNSWTPFAPVVTATSTNATFIDPSPLGERRFYRVVRLP